MKYANSVIVIGLIASSSINVAMAQSIMAKPFVANIFTNNMVLQRNQPDPIWGWTSPGSRVTAALDNTAVTATADINGRWSAKLPALPAGGPHTVTVTGPTSVVFHNVLEGDVWLCSGQSNMEFGVGLLNNPTQEINAANYPNIRINLQSRQIDTVPSRANSGTWQVCSPQTIAQGGWSGFSAVGYFFGRDLYEKLHVPIGLIESSWAGTPAEAWVSEDALRANLNNYSQRLDQIHTQSTSYDYLLPTPVTSNIKPQIVIDQNAPAELYNGMISPLIPFGIKGAIWYQGESNVGRAAEYRVLLPTLIDDWRSRWQEGPFPFYIVQLANLGKPPDQPSDDAWAELRDAQLYTAETVPNTGIAVTADIGDPDNIHPKDKQDVGRRLALLALAKTYGYRGEYSGPIYKSMRVVGSTIVISFNHVGGGLVAKGGPRLTGFAIAGDDGNYVWADSVIAGQNVLVSSPNVASPTRVRYAWSDDPQFNLYNTEGLPASPFQTDVSSWSKIPTFHFDSATYSGQAVKSNGFNPGPNYALGASFISSDPNYNGWNGLTDGSWTAVAGTTYASGDTLAFPKFVTADLNSVRTLGVIAIGVPPFGSTKTIDVSVSKDGRSFTDVGSYVFTLGTVERHVFRFNPTSARYIKLTYPDHYDQISGGFPSNFVFTTELEAYAPFSRKNSN